LNDYQSGLNLLEVEEKMLSLQKEMVLVGIHCSVLWAEALVDKRTLPEHGKMVPDVLIMEEQAAAEVVE